MLRQAADPASRIVDPYSGVLADGTSPIPVDQIDGYRASMVEHAMEADHGALTYSPSPTRGVRERERVGIGEQLSRFMRFCGSVIGNTPRAYGGYLRAGVARMLGRRLQGEDGMLVVGDDLERLDARDCPLPSRSTGSTTNRRGSTSSSSSRCLGFVVRSTPVLWSSLREMVFGSLDGSGDLEERGFVRVEGRTPVFGRVADVIHDPLDTWSPPSNCEAPRCPPSSSPSTGAPMTRCAIASTWSEPSARGRRDSACASTTSMPSRHISVRAPRNSSALLDSGTLVVNKAGDIVPAKGQGGHEPRQTLLAEYRGIEPKQRLNAKRRADVDGEVAALAARTARLEQVEHGVHGMEERQGSNFGAHLIKRVAAEQAAAARDAASLRSELAHCRIPEPGTLRRLRDRYFTRTAVLCGAWSCCGRHVHRAVRDHRRRPPPGLVAGLVVVGGDRAGVLVVVGGVFLIGYYRRWSTFNRA